MKKYFFISFIFFLFSNLQSADININPNQIFVGTDIQFNFVSPNIANILNPEWNFGDSSPKVNGTSTNHFYKEPGNYTAKFTWSEEGENKEITKNIVVGDNRKVSIEGSNFFTGMVVKFKTENFARNNLKWDFGDGIIENAGKNHNHKFQNSGNYTVKVYDFGGNTSTAIACNMNIQPDNRNIEFTPSSPSEWQEIDFKAKNFSSNNLEWDFGDGEKVNGSSTIKHVYSRMGGFSVKVKIAGTNDIPIEKRININKDLRRVEINPSYVTVGQSVKIKLINSMINVVDWNMGMDVTLKNSPNNIQYKFLDPGRYEIVCIIPNQPPVKSVINVRENRSIVLTQKYAFEGSRVQFETKNFNSPNLKWDFGDSTIQHGGKNISHMFLRPGNYIVKIFDFDGKSKKPVEKRLNVLRDNRKIELKYTVLYRNSEVEIRATNFKGNSIKWDFGDGGAQMGSNLIKHTYKRMGTFTIKAIDMGGKDTKEIMKQVNIVNDNRRIQLPAEIIAGEPVDLKLKDVQTSNFIWEFKNSEKRSGNFVKSKNFKLPGLQTIKIVDKSGKYPDLIKKIYVKPDKRELKSSKNYSLPNEIINFEALNFKGPGIKWTFGDGTIKENGNINEKHEYKSCGKYKVKAIDFNGKSAKIFSKYIYISELLPDFKVNRIEIAFNNGKYYRVTSRKNMPPGYSVKIKAKGRGIVKGQWLLDGMTIGLFEVLLKENQIKIIKGRNVPQLPVIDLGIHNFTFNFTNYSFDKKIPRIRYFVAESGIIQIKNPLPGVKISGQKIIKLKWSPAKRKVFYEIVVSKIPFQFLKDEQIKWIKLDQKNEFNFDLSKYKKNTWLYWMVRAVNENGKVLTTSEFSSFKIL